MHRDTRHIQLQLLTHIMTKRCDTICQAAAVGLRAIGTCPGPELGENTSHLEKNIIVLKRKKLNHVSSMMFLLCRIIVDCYYDVLFIVNIHIYCDFFIIIFAILTGC